MQIKLNIPKSWNELSNVQFENIVYQLHCHQTIIKDNAQVVLETSARLYLQLAKELLRGNKWFSIQRALKEIRPKEFLPWSRFIYENVSRTKFTPTFKHKGIWYHPPAQRIRNITIGEFSFADAAYYQWRETQKTIWLDVLCASLYREGNTEFSQLDNRLPFVKQAVDSRADRFENLPFKKKLAIAFSYEGCRNHIAATYPVIFPKPPELEEGQKPTKKKYVSFGKIVMDKIQGDPSKYEHTNNVVVYDFLNILSSEIEAHRKKRN